MRSISPPTWLYFVVAAGLLSLTSCQTEGTIATQDASDTAAPQDTNEGEDSSAPDTSGEDTSTTDSVDSQTQQDVGPNCVCSPGDTRCTNGREQVCNQNCERWDVIKNCAANETCMGDVCATDQPDCTCTPGDRTCQNGHVAECQGDCRTWNRAQTCASNETCQNASCTYSGSCTTPIQVVSNPGLSAGSGTFFIIDLDCPSVEIVLSPIQGSAPNQSSYRSTLATWLNDFNAAGDVAVAFNTNFSVTNADPITGAYVHSGEIYKKVYVIPGCTCPNCIPEDALYSIAIKSDGRAVNAAYNLNYDQNQCSDAYNWQKNAPIKDFESNGGIIPDGTRYLVSGIDIETGVPHHSNNPDGFSNYLGARNVMGVNSAENQLVVGMLGEAYRNATKSWMVNQGGVDGQIIVFDGGGSTKQYADHNGFSRNFEGSRQVPAIMGIRLR